METKLNVLRALSRVFVDKIIKTATIILIAAAIIVLAIIWVLAHYLSGLWWLLLIIYVPLVLFGIGALLVARTIGRRLYQKKLSRDQRKQLESFSDKIQKLIEMRGMGWWLFVILCLKDLLLHRELRTMNETIRDTKSLKHDFSELEKQLA